MSEKRAYVDMVAAACQQPAKLIQPPPTFFETSGKQRKAAEGLRSEILRAKRYILDDDVTEAAVDLGMQHPEIVLAVLKNAMAPFDTMWLEWSPHAQLQAATANIGRDQFAHDFSPANNCGALVTRVGDTSYRITMVGECRIETKSQQGAISGALQYGVSPLAIHYDIHSPVFGGTLNYAEAMVERYTPWSAEALRGALLAGAYIQPPIILDQTIEEIKEEEGITDEEVMMRISEIAQTRIRQCDMLSSHAQWIFDPLFGKPFRDRIVAGPDPLDPMSPRSRYYRHAVETLGLTIQEEAGMFRFVISVIALMISRDRLASEGIIPRIKNKTPISKGRIVPFLENRRVSLTVPRKIANRRIVRALSKAMPRAQHDVEGHWKQRRKGYDFSCEHVMVWETPKREICAIEGCGFKRWRVDEFKRGDPSIGVIKKTRVAELDRKAKPIPAVAQGVYEG